jgi:hypothetical protein
VTKPVLYAGLLGGLIGAVFSFVLSRALPHRFHTLLFA